MSNPVGYSAKELKKMLIDGAKFDPKTETGKLALNFIEVLSQVIAANNAKISQDIEKKIAESDADTKRGSRS